jgi:actin-related protein 8
MQTEKYGLRAYDEVILAPMVRDISLLFPPLINESQCLFEPRVIDFENKCQGLHPTSPNVTEEILSHQTDNMVGAS